MRRALLSWLAVLALLVAGFGASVLALNNDLFSAHGFVRSYLAALERGDAQAALQTEGVVAPDGASTALLTDGALGDLDDIRFLRESVDGELHTVLFAVDLGDGTEQAEFSVERTGTRLGLFPTWRFAASPLATLAVAVPGDARFRANGTEALAGELAVFAPGRYSLDHDTALLQADPVAVDVVQPGSVVDGVVEVRPTAAFETGAAEAVAGFLETCTEQAVLQPAGCPFGHTEANRVEGVPTWTIDEQPSLTLQATETAGVWRAVAAGGTAHLSVRVQSLFDGSVRTVEDDVTLLGDYLIALAADDSLAVSGA